MRFVAAALVLLTTWVTVASTISDRRRATGRQVRLEADTLSVTTPEGTTIVPLTDVSEAQWRSGAVGETGLWLLGHDGRVLAHLDASFLAGEDEARAFVGWARQRAVLPFNVRWPSADAAK